MPELPEVETIRRRLSAVVIGRRITAVRVQRADIVGFPTSIRAFASRVRGKTVTAVLRRGKYLILQLDNGGQLVIHLRLSGHLAVTRSSHRLSFERARFELGDGLALVFVEPRALGRIYALEATGQYPSVLTGLAKMGPEPISGSFTAEFLAAKLRGRRTAVKTLLLDQRVCCGVGNIYSDEALFRAGVRPDRRAGSLSRTEVVRLWRSLRQVLRDGIRWCGTTMRDSRYVLPDGATGGFQHRLRVFGRTDEPCRCGSTIQRGRIGGRSTHFCPSCQA